MPSAVNTKTNIINLALSSLKQTNFITSPNDVSVVANVANLWYDVSRRNTLRWSHWRFCEKNMVLSLLGDINTATSNPTINADQDIIPGWIFTYLYPAKCLKIRSIYNAIYGDFPDVLADPFRDMSTPIRRIKQAEYHIARAPVSDQDAIGTNLQNASAIYTFDETDESRFDDMFVQGFAKELSVQMCMPLTGDKELLQLLEAARDHDMGEAKRINGGEDTESESQQSRYLDSRMSS